MAVRNGMNRRSGIWGVVCVVLAASTAVLFTNIAANRRFLLPFDPKWASALFTLLLIGGLSAGMLMLNRRLRPGLEQGFKSLPVRSVDPRRFFFAVLLVNLVMLLAYYPGTESWDTIAQIKDYYDGVSRTRYAEGGGMVITALYNDHHPVATTLLFGAFVDLGRLIHSESAGLFLYSLLQITLYAYAYTQALKLSQRRCPACQGLVAAFYILNPFLPYYAIMMLKDSLFAGLFLLYLLDFIKLHRAEDKPAAGLAARFILLSVLLPLSKKTGVYIVVLSNAALLLRQLKLKRPNRTAVAAGTLLPILISFILLPRVVFPALNIFPGGKQEVLATLLQQSARTGLDHPDAYSEAEIETLDSVFRYSDAGELYSYEITDPIKNTFRLKSATGEDLKAYYKLWLKTGLKYPTSYLKATAGTCAGYFAPTTQLEVYRVNHFKDLTENPVLTALRGGIDAIYDFLMALPGLNILFYIVVWTWWIPLYASYRLMKRRGWGALLRWMPIYVSMLTLIVSPYSFSRYALPFVMVAPVLLCGAGGD